MAANEEKKDLEAEGLVAQSYTGFFRIRKRIRKIQDIVVPLREGLGVDQLAMFLLAVLVMGILYGLFVSPIVNIFEIKLTVPFFLLWFIVPGFFAAQRISKPMPHGKTIPGYVFSKIRKLLDDPVHRRGIPLAKAPRRGKAFHFQREFVVHPKFAADALTPAPNAADDSDRFYYGEPVMIEEFMASRSATHSERANMEYLASRQIERQTMRNFLIEPRAQVVSEEQ